MSGKKHQSITLARAGSATILVPVAVLVTPNFCPYRRDWRMPKPEAGRTMTRPGRQPPDYSRWPEEAN
ncbi:MAG TPA: hypothetical protein VIQ99_06150 [Gammaproteobacteria bacterium]